jgi:hypothetical protein
LRKKTEVSDVEASGSDTRGMVGFRPCINQIAAVYNLGSHVTGGLLYVSVRFLGNSLIAGTEQARSCRHHHS